MSKVFQKTHDPIWHVLGVIIAVTALQAVTNSSFLPYNKYLLIGIELTLLLILIVITPSGYSKISRSRRTIMIGTIAVITVANIFSLVLLLDALFYGGASIQGRDLLLNGTVIYLTNILMFGLWYWELDGGGPDRRATNTPMQEDFAFPQNTYPHLSKSHWQPGFVDYLYLSGTNVTNFASADTLPLTKRAKMLMLAQSMTAVLTIVLVVAKAISIIG
ncbi:MAG: hypothetical protein ABI354_01605 [Candidatus Saccharimonadales bacterium]